MNSREALSLPPDCALRQDFPSGEVYVQMSGVESHTGPAHVSLYDTPWEEVPRVPVAHVKVPMGGMADHEIRRALGAEHDDHLSDSEYGCIALDSLGAVVRTHAALVQDAVERQRAREEAATAKPLEKQPA
jgi:hypothetical protein